jgi:hypothetical protein
MYTTLEDYQGRYKKYLYLFFAGILFVFMLLALLSIPASAKITLNSTLNITNVTDTSITWRYSYLTVNRPIGATLDGVIIDGWKTDYVYNYTASELAANTTHEFCIFDEATSNCEEGTTLINPENLNSIFFKYIWLIGGIILIVIGKFVRRNEPMLIAGFIGFIGLAAIGRELLGEIIYGLLIITAFYLSFED